DELQNTFATKSAINGREQPQQGTCTDRLLSADSTGKSSTTTARRRTYASLGGRNSPALPMKGWRVRCAGAFFIMCVRPRATDVGRVASKQKGKRKNGKEKPEQPMRTSLEAFCAHHKKSSDKGQQPTAVGYKQHNSHGSHDLPLNSADTRWAGACDALAPFSLCARARHSLGCRAHHPRFGPGRR